MKMTIDHDVLTPTDILRWMAPDREYRGPEIAAHFGAKGLWNLLQRMAKAGDIAKTAQRRRLVGVVADSEARRAAAHERGRAGDRAGFDAHARRLRR